MQQRGGTIQGVFEGTNGALLHGDQFMDRQPMLLAISLSVGNNGQKGVPYTGKWIEATDSQSHTRVAFVILG
jgi:hypothetical protein